MIVSPYALELYCDTLAIPAPEGYGRTHYDPACGYPRTMDKKANRARAKSRKKTNSAIDEIT